MSELSVRATDGARLAVTSAGKGFPLLLIPGLGTTRMVMAPLLPVLAAHFHLLIIDQRGIGESERGTAAYTVSQLAQDALSVLDHLRLEKAAVMGTSFGGLVAQELALSATSRVSHLLLAATSPGEKQVARSAAADAALLGQGAKNPADAYRLACTVLYSEEFQRESPKFIEAQVRLRSQHPVDPRVFREQFSASRSWDRWPDLLKLGSTPTLVMHGTEDRIIPIDAALLLQQRIPGAEKRWFSGCGHLFFHERPEETAQAVRDFTR